MAQVHSCVVILLFCCISFMARASSSWRDQKSDWRTYKPDDILTTMSGVHRMRRSLRRSQRHLGNSWCNLCLIMFSLVVCRQSMVAVFFGGLPRQALRRRSHIVFHPHLARVTSIANLNQLGALLKRASFTSWIFLDVTKRHWNESSRRYLYYRCTSRSLRISPLAASAWASCNGWWMTIACRQHTGNTR